MRWRSVLVLASVVACASKTTTPVDDGPCVADDLEPNDAVTARRSLGVIHDEDEIGQGPDAPPKSIQRSLTLHDGADVDWLSVDVLDTGAAGNPRPSVYVPVGFEALVFFTCSSGKTDHVVCQQQSTEASDPAFAGVTGCLTTDGSSGVPAQAGLQIECQGTSTDNGRLDILVRRKTPADACARYTITVRAD